MSLGIPPVQYLVTLNDPLGNRIAIIDDYVRLDVAKMSGQLGVLTLEVAIEYEPLFSTDYILEVLQVVDGVATLFLDLIWFVRRRVVKGKSGSPTTLEITAYDPLFIIGGPSADAGRIIAYNELNSYTEKLTYADDMMKAIMRENVGSLASDTTRSLATYLSIQSDVSRGPTLRKEFSRRNVLSTLQEIAQASIQAGTYLSFDIVNTVPLGGGPVSLEFRTYTGQRGVDHRSSTNNSLLIGPDFGNLDDWELNRDSSDEVTYVYAGGQSVANVMAIAEVSDATRIGISPFNRRETFFSWSGVGDAADLTNEARARLKEGSPKFTLEGEIIDSPQSRFGVNWSFGDFLTAQVRGFSFDCHADSIELKIDRSAIHLFTKLRSY